MDFFSFQWHITEACDQRCKHCYIYALGSHAQFKVMPLDDMRLVLSNISTFGRKAQCQPYLYLTGGDPLLHPDFKALLALLRAQGIPFTVLGNPYHLTDEMCQELKQSGCRQYQLSLDGLQATHDDIRRAGSFAETLRAIPILKRHGIAVATMTTVSRSNYKEVPALIDVAVEAGVDVFAFARYCPDAGTRTLCCSPAEYRDMMEACWAKFEQYKDADTYFSLKDHLWTLFKYEHGLFNPDAYPADEIVYDGCNCGNGHFTILSDGACYACRRMESKVGNALSDDLYELFCGPAMDAYRQYERFEKCARCKLLRFCRGCPAVAAGYHGSMYAPDPECWMAV